ncbi:MAG: hypothetical protein AABX37_03290, partial [Nanoarchaeota archaeon]
FYQIPRKPSSAAMADGYGVFHNLFPKIRITLPNLRKVALLAPKPSLLPSPVYQEDRVFYHFLYLL